MRKGLDSFKLKLIALIFMIVDHIFVYLNAPIHSYQADSMWPEWIPVLTRFVSPLFLYLMIDGFYHTRSRKKYLIRLFIAALIMQIGNIVLNLLTHNVDSSTGKYSLYSLITGPNIFLTLALLFSLIWCFENIKKREHKVLSVFMAFIIAPFTLFFTEGGFFLLPIAIFIWIFRKRKPLQCAGILVWCLILLAYSVFSYHSYETGTSLYSYLCFDNEWANLLVIPFILLYNGERGKNTLFTKYMFYLIYPVHIWILTIVKYLILK